MKVMFEAKIVGDRDYSLIEMRDMKPCQIGIIEDSEYGDSDEIVMRTAETNKFEVMSLSNPNEDNCWTGNPTIKVRLLPPGTKIMIEVK
jgi:hypothetical protein